MIAIVAHTVPARRSRPVRRARLLVATLLLLLYAGTRLHQLTVLPLFTDESFHIEQAQRVRNGQPLASANEGKLLRIWLDAAVGPDAPGAGFAARAITVLVSMLGVAAFYALARSLVSPLAGVLAALLWTAAPYLVFFERLDLADTLLAALSAVALWAAWQVVARPSRARAVLLGGALALVPLAKVPGIAWLPLPLVAVLLLPRASALKRVTLAAWGYGACAALWGPLLLVLHLKHYNYLMLVTLKTDSSGRGLAERLPRNLDSLWHTDVAYLSLPLLIVAIGGGLYWLRVRPRGALLALAALGMSAGAAALFGQNINSRYALNQAAWVLLPAAAGLGLWVQRHPRGLPLAAVAVALWGIVFCLPFLWDIWTDPTALALTAADRYDYVRGEASGYGIAAIAEWLQHADPRLPTVGLLASCRTLRLMAYTVDVNCPVIHWEGNATGPFLADVQARAADGPLYVVLERLPYLQIDALPQPNVLLLTAQRPDDGLPVQLYRVEQGAQLATP